MQNFQFNLFFIQKLYNLTKYELYTNMKRKFVAFVWSAINNEMPVMLPLQLVLPLCRPLQLQSRIYRMAAIRYYWNCIAYCAIRKWNEEKRRVFVDGIHSRRHFGGGFVDDNGVSGDIIPCSCSSLTGVSCCNSRQYLFIYLFTFMFQNFLSFFLHFAFAALMAISIVNAINRSVAGCKLSPPKCIKQKKVIRINKIDVVAKVHGMQVFVFGKMLCCQVYVLA